MTEYEKGSIHIRAVFNVVGSPKEHVEASLKEYIENIKKDKRITFLQEHFEPAVEKEKIWHTFSELDLVIKNIDVLIWLVINFNPASIEIVEPASLTLSNRQLTAWITNLISKLDEIGLAAKQVGSENKMLIKNMNRLIKNSVLLCLSGGIQVPEEISKTLGIDTKFINQFLEALIKEKRVKQEGDKFVKLKIQKV